MKKIDSRAPNAEIKARHCGKAITRIGEDWSVLPQRPGRNR